MFPQRPEPTENGSRLNCVREQSELAGGETILLVEDEKFVREVTEQVLKSAGYKVLTAKNAAEAQVQYSRQCGELDLLLTDLLLPGETGRALARKLRLRQPELKVLFVTGYAEQLRPIEPEGTECLAKPFSSEVLLRKINDLLNSGNDTEEDLSVKHACGTALL